MPYVRIHKIQEQLVTDADPRGSRCRLAIQASLPFLISLMICEYRRSSQAGCPLGPRIDAAIYWLKVTPHRAEKKNFGCMYQANALQGRRWPLYSVHYARRISDKCVQVS